MSFTECDPMIQQLDSADLVNAAHATARPLTGGVSSDIWLVTDGANRLVVKRALAKLRVKDDWHADTSRNRVERDWLDYAATIVPQNVPRVLYAPTSGEWFAMEYVGDQATTWKSQLLAGVAEPPTARLAGDILGRLHAHSWGSPGLVKQFATLANFRELRIAPYLHTAAVRVPALALLIGRVAAEMEQTQLALVHGDFSPKNLLVVDHRLVVVDAEVAWFGDPAFDTAFLLCHLMLKGLFQGPGSAAKSILELAPVFWAAYRLALQAHWSWALEERTIRITLCLLLARVHGKSPVEYLQPVQQNLVTSFVALELPHPPALIAELGERWLSHLGLSGTS